MNTLNPAASVSCPVCRAIKGEPCTTPTEYGRKVVTWYHTSRSTRAVEREPEDLTHPVEEFKGCVLFVDAATTCGRKIHSNQGNYCRGHRERLGRWGDMFADIPIGKLRFPLKTKDPV